MAEEKEYGTEQEAAIVAELEWCVRHGVKCRDATQVAALELIKALIAHREAHRLIIYPKEA